MLKTPPGVLRIYGKPLPFETGRRKAQRPVGSPSEVAQFTTAFVGKDSAQGVGRVAKERFVLEQVYTIYICLHSFLATIGMVKGPPRMGSAH